MTPSDPLLNEKAGIVTGAGSGVGAQIARTLAAAGMRVCVNDLNPDRADRVAGEIAAAGGEAFAWQADVSNRFQVAALIEQTRERYGRLDLLAHNAHVSPAGDILLLGEWEWRRLVEVNLVGALFCAQLAARVMADEGGGLIAFVTRPAEETGRAAFAATQGGLAALAGAMGRELAGREVRVEVLPVSAEAPLSVEALLALV